MSPSPPPSSGAFAFSPSPSPHHHQQEQQQPVVVKSIQLDTELFRSRPGLTIRHLAWHPDSDTHLAILTSDNVLGLYNINSNPLMAEQTFELGKQSRRAVIGRLRGEVGGVGGGKKERRKGGQHHDDDHHQPTFTSFAFHLPSSSSSSSSVAAQSWERYCIYFLSSHGHLYSLCPVVPFGCAFSSRIIHNLKQSVSEEEDGNTQAWLQRAFTHPHTSSSSSSISTPPPSLPKSPPLPPLSSHSPSSSTIIISVPHALDEHSPVLVGPIPFITPGSDPFSSFTGTSSGGAGSIIDFTTTSTSSGVESMLWMSVGNGCSAVLISTTDGTVGAHVLTGTAVPTWQESTPQCLLSSSGTGVMAVRSQVSSTGGPYLSLQQLLLLDVIQLNCPENSSSRRGYSAQDLQDDDDDDDYNGIYNDTRPSSCIFLTQDLEAEEVAYCIHATGGVYAITLPWLPLLSSALLTAAMNTTTSSGSGRGGMLSHSPSSSIVLPSVLPPATVATLFPSTSVAAVNGGIIDCVAVGDKLAGSGLLLLLGDGSYRCLSRKGGGGGVSGDGGGGQQLLQEATADEEEQEEREIKAQVKAIYGDLLHPPPGKTPLPSTNSKSGVATPEGQRQLSQCIKALQSTHAEYAHKVHHDLLERLPLIKQEVEKQKFQITAIKQLAEKVNLGSQSLQKRAGRAEQMQVNLEERLRLLAELHVAIPRPVSVAEQRFAKGELPELEGAVRDMVADIKMIRGRAAYIKATGGGTNTTGTFSMHVPPAQMKRLKEALDQHGQGIMMALDRLSVLESALNAQEAQVVTS